MVNIYVLIEIILLLIIIIIIIEVIYLLVINNILKKLVEVNLKYNENIIKNYHLRDENLK